MKHFQVYFIIISQSLLNFKQKSLMSKSLPKVMVAIVGCGPVGMLGSLLSQHLGIDYITLQKYASPRSHPSAHWLSANSKAIMSQVPHLSQDINSNQQPWENFRYYRYLQSLFGHELAVTDHFKPSIQQKIKRSIELFGQSPNHIPQNRLLQIMFQRLKNKQNIQFSTQIKGIQKSSLNSGTKMPRGYTLFDQTNNPVVTAENIILCSGVSTNLRNRLPPPFSQFHMQGHSDLMNVINIHFNSKMLASKIKENNRSAMLHFVYGKKIIGILVNHEADRNGTFVLQIPNYEPFVDLLEIYSARDLINMIFQENQNHHINDINVIHVGKWKLQGILADSMHKNGIFLAGDAAHAYPPAGGFGMNSGFQDIHQLIHSIYMKKKNPASDHQKIQQYYSQNRRKVNSEYLRKAMQNYELTKNISISLGYSPNILDYFSKSSIFNSFVKILPQGKTSMLETIRLKAMSLMYRRKQITPGLNLFFDEFDYSIQNLSKIRKSILNQIKIKGAQSPNLYARKGDISIEEIRKVYGNIQQKNVHFFNKQQDDMKDGEKLINSNGNVIIK